MCLISDETCFKSAGILFLNFATHPVTAWTSDSECQQSRKPSNPRHAEGGNGRRRNQQNNCLTATIDFIDDDFDFESNLALFDKQAVFEEIERDIDDGYLPPVNRHKQPAKYKCDENVLQSGPVVYRQISVPGSTVEFVTGET